MHLWCAHGLPDIQTKCDEKKRIEMKIRNTFKYFCGMCWGCFIFCTLVLVGLLWAGIWGLVVGNLAFGLGAIGLSALYGVVMAILILDQARYHYNNGVACFEI